MSAEAKKQIAALTQEIMTKQQQLNELMRTSPPEPVADYVLAGADGPVKLSELFAGQRDLILIHNMGKSCPYCTLWADGFNGVSAHFENRAAFALVSPDSPAVQREFSSGRHWSMRMVSSEGTSFTEDLGFASPGGTMPGYSTFYLQDDGSIERVASAFFGPGDTYAPIWHMIGVLKEGIADWQPRFEYP